VFTRKERPQQPEQTTVDPTLALPDVRSTPASGVNKTAVRDPFTPASEESNDESDANIQVIPVMNPADSATPTATVAQPSSSEAPAQPEEGQPSSAGQGVPANTIKVQPVAIARGPAAIARPSATVDHSRAQLPQSLKLSNPINLVQTASTTLPPIVSSALTPVVLPEETAKQLLLNQVQPVYPDQALRAGLQGPVVLQAWIARDGSIRDVKLVRGSFVLARAAVEAVKQWHYKPYYVNGQAVEAQTVITVNFRLPTSSLNSGKSVEAISSVVQDTAKP
jgi:TonB family protein